MPYLSDVSMDELRCHRQETRCGSTCLIPPNRRAFNMSRWSRRVIHPRSEVHHLPGRCLTCSGRSSGWRRWPAWST